MWCYCGVETSLGDRVQLKVNRSLRSMNRSMKRTWRSWFFLLIFLLPLLSLSLSLSSRKQLPLPRAYIIRGYYSTGPEAKVQTDSCNIIRNLKQNSIFLLGSTVSFWLFLRHDLALKPSPRICIVDKTILKCIASDSACP